MVSHKFLLYIAFTCLLATLVQPQLRSLRRHYSPSISYRKLLGSISSHDAGGKHVTSLFSLCDSALEDCGHTPVSAFKAKETIWEARQTLIRTPDQTGGALTDEHVSARTTQMQWNTLKESAALHPTQPEQIQVQQSSTPSNTIVMESMMPRATSTSVSSFHPLSTQLTLSASNAISTHATPSPHEPRTNISSPPSSTPLPSLTSSFVPSASHSVDSIAPVASTAPQWTSSFSPHTSTVDVSASPSFTRTASPPIWVSSLPSPPASSPEPAETSSPSPSQLMRASATSSATFRASPEVSPSLEDSGDTGNPAKHLTIGGSVTISNSSGDSLLNRTGEPLNDTQFSDVLIILSMKNSRQRQMPTTAHQQSLNVSDSVTVRACVEELIWNEESPPFISLHAFERPTLAETDLVVSRGFRTSFRYNETHTCLMGLALEIPSDKFSTVYLVLSQRLSSDLASVIQISAVQSKNSVAASPLVWNRDLLSIPEKANMSLDITDKAKVFVISSWPNLLHVELKDARVDRSGLRHIYGPTSRFPNPSCDDSGTQLVTSIVGKYLGIGPNQIATIPVPVRDCEEPYSVDAILGALNFVTKSIEIPSSLNTFVIFDDQLLDSGFLSDPRLRKELDELANAGVITFVPGRQCQGEQASYITVGAFGRRVDETSPSSIEFVIHPSECWNMFDVFGPGDLSTAASIAGPESYANVIWGSNVAAGGVLSVFLLMSIDQNRKLNITEAKTLLQGLTRTTPVIVNLTTGELNGPGPALPLLGGATSLSDLRRSFTGLPSSNPTGNGIIRFFKSLPIGAIIGICLAVCLVLVLIVVGGVFAYRRRRGSEEEDEQESTFDEDIENAALQDNLNYETQNNRMLQRPPTITDIHSPLPSMRPPSESRDIAKGRPVQPQPIRVPVVQRLLSLNRAKESPITRGDKASWFATPRNENPGNDTFQR